MAESSLVTILSFLSSLSPSFLEGQIILFCVWIVGHWENKVLACRLKFSS